MKYVQLTIFCFAFLMACSSDDENTTQMQQMEEEDPPSDFVVVVDDVTFDTGAISWTQPIGTNNENLLYAVSLNNINVAEGLSELSYTFENLEVNANYNLKVVASNSFGATEATTNFNTLNPEDFTFLLKTLNESVPNTLEYNQQGLVSKISNFDTTITYEYDTMNRLVNQFQTDLQSSVEHICTYSGTNLSSITREAWFIDGGTSTTEYTFFNENNYSIVRDVPSLSLTVSLERNTNGDINSYKLFDDEGALIQELLFSYDNGNITQVIDVAANNTFEVTYDDMNNYLTYRSYSNWLFSNTIAGVNWPNDIRSKISAIPEFHFWRNKNNVLTISRNGTLIPDKNILYEYNVAGFPSKIIYTAASRDVEYYIDEN